MQDSDPAIAKAQPCCARCGAIRSNMKACGRCRLAYYCNELCQRADWNSAPAGQTAWHRLFCQFVCDKDAKGLGELVSRTLAFVIKDAAALLIDQISIILRVFSEQHKGCLLYTSPSPRDS